MTYEEARGQQARLEAEDRSNYLMQEGIKAEADTHHYDAVKQHPGILATPPPKCFTCKFARDYSPSRCQCWSTLQSVEVNPQCETFCPYYVCR